MTSAKVTDDESVLAFRTLLLLAQELRYLFDRRLQADGLTTAQATALTFAEQHRDRPLSYKQLADRMATSHQNVAQIVEALDRKGFVEKRVDADDGRVRRVHVTEQSRRYWATRDEGDVAYLQSLFSALTSDDLERLNQLLGELQAHVRDVYFQERNTPS